MRLFPKMSHDFPFAVEKQLCLILPCPLLSTLWSSLFPHRLLLNRQGAGRILGILLWGIPSRVSCLWTCSGCRRREGTWTRNTLFCFFVFFFFFTVFTSYTLFQFDGSPWKQILKAAPLPLPFSFNLLQLPRSNPLKLLKKDFYISSTELHQHEYWEYQSQPQSFKANSVPALYMVP